MSTDPWLGSFVWLTSSIAFLTAGTAVVRMLDTRPGWTAGTPERVVASRGAAASAASPAPPPRSPRRRSRHRASAD